MNFTNPTAGGRIQAQAEVWDGTSIRVTRDCAGHRATNQGCALDLGDGKCTRPVLAVAAGTVTYRNTVQGILRIDHGGGWQSDYAHMSPLLVAIGTKVTQGQQIGEIGDAHDPTVLNFFGCHLHFGILLNGVEQDPWPLLNQNQETTDVLKGTFIEGIWNRRATTLGPTQFLADPTDNSGGVLAQFAAGRAFDPAFVVAGVTLAGSNRWYGGWGQTAKGLEFGYLHGSALGPMVPRETVGGITQAQLDAAVAKAAMDAKVAAAKAGATGAAKAASDFAASLP